MNDYDVVIVGGGPVGIALGIELGMLNIKTVIFEKHQHPFMLPRAQLLNPRSMEFFRRWGISQTLIRKKLLPNNYPLRSTWCSGLAGETYCSINTAENINKNMSPENYQRVPLWITEEVLRERLKDFKSVTFIKNNEVTDVTQNNQHIITKIKNRENHQEFSLCSSYIVGCDGANSLTRKIAQIEMQTELPPVRMINVMFRSSDLKEKMTVPKGILYYNLTLQKPAGLGCIDYENNLWYSLITYPVSENITEKISDINISYLLDEIAGFSFQKEIIQSSFWLRQAQIAKQFSQQRIFLAGDAAHILPPNGGHGLNTGLGDAVNLAWKIAAVLNQQAGEILLDSYNTERRPVALRNILITKKNAADAAQIRKKYPPEIMPDAFAKENERIAKQHTISTGIALGYCYPYSPIIFDAAKQDNNFSFYQPTAEPGFFAPHYFININKKKSLYDLLSNYYNLIIIGKNNDTKLTSLIQAFSHRDIALKILPLKNKPIKNIYPKKYYLLRPDWHIAWHGDEIPSNLGQFMNHLMPN